MRRRSAPHTAATSRTARVCVIQLLETPAECVGDGTRHAQRQARSRRSRSRRGRRRAVREGRADCHRSRDEAAAPDPPRRNPRMTRRAATAPTRDPAPPIASDGSPATTAFALRAARTEQDDDRIGREPSRGEDERVRRGAVGEVQVVDDDRDRAVLGISADQAQHRRADREPVAGMPPNAMAPGRASAEASASAWTGGMPSSTPSAGRSSCSSIAERDLALGLEAGGAQHPHLGQRRRRHRRAARSCRRPPRR